MVPERSTPGVSPLFQHQSGSLARRLGRGIGRRAGWCGSHGQASFSHDLISKRLDTSLTQGKNAQGRRYSADECPEPPAEASAAGRGTVVERLDFSVGQASEADAKLAGLLAEKVLHVS